MAVDTLVPHRAPISINVEAFADPHDLREAVMQVGIVLVRAWSGDEAQFVQIGRVFGELEKATPKVPLHRGQLFKVTSRPNDEGGVGRYWHADGFAYSSDPPVMTIYHVAKGASPAAGTSFLDGFAAWRAISSSLQARVEDAWWVHTSGHRHPFVRNHEVHKRPALSVNLGKVARIEGLEEAAQRHLLEDLASELDRLPAYTHGWEVGHLLLVDNRRMLHRAPLSTAMEREVWRTSVIRFHE